MNGKWSSWLRLLFFVICLLIFLLQGKELGSDILSNHQADEEYKHWTDDTKEKSDGGCSVDFKSLQKKNPDIVGWIRIPDSSINYPIVQGEDNEYYLKHTAAKKENHAGAIFLDAECSALFSSGNSIIYGHNLRGEKMFGALKRLYDPDYSGDASLLAHPDIYIDVPQGQKVYHIFSVRKIHANLQKDIYAVDFAGEKDWKEYVAQAVEDSLLDGDSPPDEMTSLLTLTTCTSEGKDGRLIVQAYAKEEDNRDNVE